jgi:hypothetical protein
MLRTSAVSATVGDSSIDGWPDVEAEADSDAINGPAIVLLVNGPGAVENSVVDVSGGTAEGPQTSSNAARDTGRTGPEALTDANTRDCELTDSDVVRVSIGGPNMSSMSTRDAGTVAAGGAV